MSYQEAKKKYAALGVDTEKAIRALKKIPVSMHCWQGDDVTGFENAGALTGGIQATGNYPGKARTPEELMRDLEFAFKLIPGKHRLNLHACYAIFEDGKKVDRDKLEPKHFKRWVEFAKKLKIGLDFNPTFFSHPLADQLTLASEDPKVRAFWVRHGIACLKIAEYFGKELGTPCSCNFWVPDGYKDDPSDRMGPRKRLKDSYDKIFKYKYNKKYVTVTVESKLYGIGVESYTVGSHEFYMNYAAKNGVMCLLDTGHFHPTEMVSDKLSSMLLFYDKVALHVSRPVRWDSDHVVLFDDETREIAKEIVRGGTDRFVIALDFFDASINRVAAWVTGMRDMIKALLYAELLPNARMAELQDKRNFTELMVVSEEMKTMPFGDVWNYYLHEMGVPENWFGEVVRYENEVLSKRG